MAGGSIDLTNQDQKKQRENQRQAQKDAEKKQRASASQAQTNRALEGAGATAWQKYSEYHEKTIARQIIKNQIKAVKPFLFYGWGGKHEDKIIQFYKQKYPENQNFQNARSMKDVEGGLIEEVNRYGPVFTTTSIPPGPNKAKFSGAGYPDRHDNKPSRSGSKPSDTKKKSRWGTAALAGTAVVATGFLVAGAANQYITGEQAKLLQDRNKNLWCVSNFVAKSAQEPTTPDPALLGKGGWIRRQQIKAKDAPEANQKAIASGWPQSEKERLRQALTANDEDFFTHHFNVGATSRGPCLGSGIIGEHIGGWINDEMLKECSDSTSGNGASAAPEKVILSIPATGCTTTFSLRGDNLGVNITGPTSSGMGSQKFESQCSGNTITIFSCRSIGGAPAGDSKYDVYKTTTTCNNGCDTAKFVCNPAKNDTYFKPDTAPNSGGTSTGSTYTYTVTAADKTWGDVASRRGVTVADLQKYNTDLPANPVAGRKVVYRKSTDPCPKSGPSEGSNFISPEDVQKVPDAFDNTSAQTIVDEARKLIGESAIPPLDSVSFVNTVLTKALASGAKIEAPKNAVQATAADYGMNNPGTLVDQTAKNPNYSKLKPGDILILGNNSANPQNLAIYTGNEKCISYDKGNKKFVEENCSGIQTSYISAKRVVEDKTGNSFVKVESLGTVKYPIDKNLVGLGDQNKIRAHLGGLYYFYNPPTKPDPALHNVCENFVQTNTKLDPGSTPPGDAVDLFSSGIKGSNIYAVFDGNITTAKCAVSGGFKDGIELTSTNKSAIAYYFGINLTKRGRVQAGDIIGTIGSGGYLHFELLAKQPGAGEKPVPVNGDRAFIGVGGVGNENSYQESVWGNMLKVLGLSK